ncbi:MAG: methylated-DNA--[protein]-cysteine S-methyltransferase [Desulfomonilia bacterium]
MTYFSGRSQAYPGAAFFLNQRIVWRREAYPSEPKTRTHQILHKITQIPYGTTTSYGSIARSLGNIRLARSVGHACGSNPLPVIIPCHRVVGATSLGGYSSGVSRKLCLLELERNSMNQP